MAESNVPESLASAQVQRYLPPELAAPFDNHENLDAYSLEAFIHLAAARYTVTTYLPRILARQILHEHQTNPWLTWLDGSLLFADLSGSTALAERLSTLGREGTERVTDALNQIFGTMISVVERFGGDLIAFGGDALLVLFDDANHSQTAAHAALALQDSLHGYSHDVPGIGSFPMHMHVGIESGRIGFASAGLEHARHCCVLGEAVNRVAAAEGLAGAGEIVAGPVMTAALGDAGNGTAVAPGFLKLEALTTPQPLPVTLAEEPPLTRPPHEAIPHLLDDLNRISSYIPPVLLEKILADPQRPQVEAELRPVTVLFAQCVGIETLAETLPATAAASALQVYVGEMQEAVELFGGVVNKIDVADEGLKLVAIFGAPTAYEDHAERAALAGMEMQGRMADCTRRITALSEQSIIKNQWLIKQRIGLNGGTAFAGNVGSAARKEYTVMGDAVNVAARVMGKAEWGEVWCSAVVAGEVAARLVCEERGAVALKGKAQPLPLLRLTGRREARVDEPQPTDGPLIGRERELATLRGHLAAAKSGTGRAVRIVGEAGVGKSRLTCALIEDARAAGFRVISASCFSYTSGIPYAAWGEWLKARCGIVASDGNAERIRKLAGELAKLGTDMEEWLPVLGDLARLDVAENRLTRGLDPKLRQTRRFELLEQLLLQAADERPVLVLFEDMHWADSISLELWARIATRLAEKTVLLLGVHRPGIELPDNAAEHVLHLRELSANDSSAMVAALSGTITLPDAMLQQVVARAGGNPLFLSELIYAVQEKIQLSTSGSSASPLLSTIDELPDSLNGLLLARIDRLDETSRSVLRIASVIGQRIPFGVLRSLQPQEQEALVRQMLRLDAYELTTQERTEPERVHVFRHALIQEVAYQSMLYARRRELHGRIGAYLERRYAADLDDYLGLIAHHYRLSDRREKALEYLLKAGHAASAMYANEEAIQSFQWAIEIIGDDERMWEARDALADVFATIGRYDDALTQYNAILATPDVPAEATQRAHRKRGAVLEKQGQYAAALDDLDRAMAIATTSDASVSPLAVPMICADIALVYKRQGEYDRAITACEQGLGGIDRDPRTREDEQIEARLHSELGGIYGMRGDYPRARHHFEHSLRIREMIDDLPGLTAAHNNLGYLWQLQSEYEKAIEHYKVAEEVARRINLRFMLIYSYNNQAYALLSTANYQLAKQKCELALQLAHQMSDQHNVAQIYLTLGVIFFHQGKYRESIQKYDEALKIQVSLGSSYQEANALLHKAVSLCGIKKYTDAIVVAEEAIKTAEIVQSQRLVTECLNVLGEASLGLGLLTKAELCVMQALNNSETLQSKYDSGISKRLLGEILSLQGREYRHFFEESVSIFVDIRNQFELSRTQAALGRVLIAHGQIHEGNSLLKIAEQAFISMEAFGELHRLGSPTERSI